ncbi:MAG: hypothetical protein MUE36_12705 [Acidimicrobiales bacterium]|jgi:hypothetical protein|nr:hypothetical protein [Acidimicrobiales bacterium]
MDDAEVRRCLEAGLAEREGEPVEVTVLAPHRAPAVEADEPWLEAKYGAGGGWNGVVPATLAWRTASGRDAAVREVVVKVSPPRGLAEGLIPWIVERYGIPLPRPYGAWRAATETTGTARRELEAQRLGGPVVTHGPGLVATAVGGSGEGVVVLDLVSPLAACDVAGRLDGWTPDRVDVALAAVAEVHAAHFPTAEHLIWAGPRRRTDDREADAALWGAILDDARRRFPDIVDDRRWRRRRALVETIGAWHPARDVVATTLVHDDFNVRNVGFRTDGRAVVFDWELASRDTPWRDVVEMLTFALEPTVERTTVDRHLGAYLRALDAACTDRGVGPDLRPGPDLEASLPAIAAEVRTEAVDRMSMQFLFGAAFPLLYLGRINATVDRLVELYP